MENIKKLSLDYLRAEEIHEKLKGELSIPVIAETIDSLDEETAKMVLKHFVYNSK